MRVLCMHTAGLGELVADALRTDADAHVAYADDSALLVETAVPPTKISRLRYLKNCFAVLGSVPRRGDLQRSVDAAVRQVPGWSLRRTGRPFRFMFSEDGRLAGVPAGSRKRLEAVVSRATGGRFTPRGGGDEFWMIARRDLDQVLFAERLARPATASPPKGALAPDLAALIVSAAGSAAPTDVVLDPFAGTGALVAARIRQPFRAAICSDLGYRDHSVGLSPDVANARGVRQLAEDAAMLPSVETASVDLVVTDPPWGEFDGDFEPDASFFGPVLDTISRVLRPDGRLAMLVARRLEEQVGTQWATYGLEPKRSYPLLVNGHPATLLVGLRTSRIRSGGADL